MKTKEIQTGKSYWLGDLLVTIVRKIRGERVEVTYDDVSYAKTKPTKFLTHNGKVVTAKELSK